MIKKVAARIPDALRRRRAPSCAPTQIPPGAWLGVIVVVDLVLALVVRIPSLLGLEPLGESSRWQWVLDAVMLSFVPIVVYAAVRITRQRRAERMQAYRSSGQVRTMMRTSREWLWAVDSAGSITFSSPMCEQLTGYAPEELVGSPIGLVLDPSELATALRSQPVAGDDKTFTGLVLVCRHRDGSGVLMEVTGQAVVDAEGTLTGFEGMARAVEDLPSTAYEADHIRRRVSEQITANRLVTAFQPIRCLSSGRVIGVEALSRFPASEGTSPEAWFVQAASVGLGVDLELLALRKALNAALQLSPGLYVAVNLSPEACLDTAVHEAIWQGPVDPSRVVIEVTERQEVSDYAALFNALAPLRAAGLRVAIDDAGAGFASMRHIIKLKPDLIKLDRAIVRDIDTETSHRALGAAMVGFAVEIGASLLAEGVETETELQAVTALGMAAGQGYYLGRPSVHPADWACWGGPAEPGAGVSDTLPEKAGTFGTGSGQGLRRARSTES